MPARAPLSGRPVLLYRRPMATIPRLYVKSDLRENGFAALDDAQAKYLTRVMRLSTGDHVRVFNGRDGEWDAVIDMVEGRTVLLKAVARTKDQDTLPNLTLLFAPLKKARTDYVVEKATELGACVIRPVITARTQSERVRVERLQKIALEAAEQTERLDVPVVEAPVALNALQEVIDPGASLYFCDEAGNDPSAPWGGGMGRAEPMLGVVSGRTEEKAAAILIGPEGGFTPEERAWLRSLPNVTPVTLGPRVLRAETAAVAALTLWEAALGDWSR